MAVTDISALRKKRQAKKTRNLIIKIFIVLLICGAAMLFYGAWRGEAETVLSKAIRLCLECVGIG